MVEYSPNPPGSPSATKTCTSQSGNHDGLRHTRPHSQLHSQPSNPSPEPSTPLAETVSRCPSMSQFCCTDATALWCLQPHPYRFWVVIMEVIWEVISKMQETHFEVLGDPNCQLQDTHPRRAEPGSQLGFLRRAERNTRSEEIHSSLPERLDGGNRFPAHEEE